MAVPLGVPIQEPFQQPQPVVGSQRVHLVEKITLGVRLRASKNSAETSFEDSPKYLDRRLLTLTLKNVAVSPLGAAAASNVLPVPGGP